MNQTQSMLTREQLSRLSQAVADLSPSELTWASGYLAGLAASNARSQPTALPTIAEATKPARTLSIFYGSQTGNSKRLAEALHQQAIAAQVPSKLVNLADFSPRQLKQEVAALFVISTQGDGDPPEDAVALFDYLQAPSAPRLEKLKFSVLALGDSSYPYFCQAGRNLDERLAELGASRVLDRVECDLDFDAPASQWSVDALKQIADTVRVSGLPRIAIVESTPKVSAPTETAHLSAVGEVLLNQRLSGRYSSKDVRHLEFAVDGATLGYQPGDGLALLPRNPQPVVESVLTALGATGEELVGRPQGSRRLTDVLVQEVELTLLSKQFLTAYQTRAAHPALAKILDPSTPVVFANYLATHQVVDVLQLAPHTWSPEEFLSLLRPLARRTYSIASSLAATPDEAHLLVAVVEDRVGDQIRYGAASNTLASLQAGAEIEVHLEPNQNFRLPADDAPLIMIGPGTGVAPFRAFVAERAVRGANGRNWLFFGERTHREDFLYQIEWQKALANGTLQRLDVAFSRDQQAKIYVQDRIREQAQTLYAWLEDGAHIYVCGDAKHMAKDVHAALHTAIETAAGVDAEAARDYIQDLQRNGRYRRDVY
jgi:sulfite reductase (NADPH) flavoprotein alpha-component